MSGPGTLNARKAIGCAKNRGDFHTTATEPKERNREISDRFKNYSTVGVAFLPHNQFFVG